MRRTSTLLAVTLAGTALTLGACAGGTPATSPSPSGGSLTPSVSGSPAPTGGTPGGTTRPGGPGTPTGTATPPDPPVSSPRPKFPPRPSMPPKTPTDASPGVYSATVTGTISPGVEGNCLLLNGYLLIGGPRDLLKPGARVTVAGRIQRGMVTTCQQGTPLVVERAHPA